ncbi:M20/M25/M40 family metallo-hydrolase [Pyxidicoccus sp. MSG2]|uniref:M20/M25/M40 family metallo-hydrolase n=1 Tax=Pyxidicoccus sp. MSG2 TaxID=2996790 RepID=UPI00226DA0C3|nr:M20/M25/M40 family metallo-hydrolase [Pyxidicoccus sp. MSG2]MCY1016483.1 M20/M25/M40 family metallo-hydrolase [Pyxidicoccus sp. MSG2]
MRAREQSPDLLRWMVEQYSPSHHEQAFSRALAGRLEQRGWSAHVDEVGNTIASLGDGDTCIALLGHIDTVPGEVPVRLEGSRLFGRGAVDAKGALGAFIEAVELLDAQERAGKRFLLLGCVEEEVAITRGALHLREHYRPDFVVNGEPSGAHAVTVGYKGLTRLELEHRASRRHTASRDYRAPAEHVIEAWNALRRRCDGWNEGRTLFEQDLPSLTSFHTGTEEAEEWAKASVSIRTGPSCERDALLASLAGVPDVNVHTLSSKGAVSAGQNDALTRAFKQALRERGVRPTLRLKTGTSDWNTVASAWQVPIVAYGPGDSALDHTPNEHIDLAEYEEGIAVLSRVLALLPTKDGTPG